MYIERIELENFGPFKGSHAVNLNNQVYAVMAQLDDNIERSNWLGKTTFLAAIRFALYGKHSWTSEDAWITDGESSGMAGLVLSTGMVITRHRKRGSSTQLEVTVPGQAISNQARAQEIIDLHLGMDYEASCNGPFIGQKQIARLVVAKPAERTGIINGWLALGPLQDAADDAQAGLTKLLKQDEQLSARLNALHQNLEEAAEDIEPLLAQQDEMELERIGIKETIDSHSEHSRQAERAEKLEIIRKTGKRRAAHRKGLGEPSLELYDLNQVVKDADELHRAAHDTWSDLNSLDADGFDGQCPIICDVCPSKEVVHDRLGEVLERLPEAEQEADITEQAAEDARTKLIDTAASNEAIAEVDKEIESLRADARDLLPAAAYMKKHGEVPDQAAEWESMQLLSNDLIDIKTRIRVSESVTKRIAERDEERQNIIAKRLTLVDSIRTQREAVAVLGRGGVQREIAEESMGAIEGRANGLLAAAGMDLTIQIKWSREGNGLATNCDACGAPYPKGRGVKECDACGATRGPKMIEKVHFDMSNRSGAADDMAGLAFQLAATSWQREAKGMLWSSVLIDEPFGACDPANAKAMGHHLHSMIRGEHGFDQGFIVAHDARIMESMPARVIIRSDGTHARLEVA